MYTSADIDIPLIHPHILDSDHLSRSTQLTRLLPPSSIREMSVVMSGSKEAHSVSCGRWDDLGLALVWIQWLEARKEARQRHQ